MFKSPSDASTSQTVAAQRVPSGQLLPWSRLFLGSDGGGPGGDAAAKERGGGKERWQLTPVDDPHGYWCRSGYRVVDKKRWEMEGRCNGVGIRNGEGSCGAEAVELVVLLLGR